jgi:allantoate deiminase
MDPSLAQKTLDRIDELAAISDEPGHLLRTFLSPAMQRANALVGGWMKALGGTVEVDGWGNLIGHFEGSSPDAKTLLLGSHLDTVPNAGKFDGPLGVLVALAALESLAARGVRLPFHVDVIGFSDEEGTRFHSAYLGSAALAGVLTETELELRDRDGLTVREVVAQRQGARTISPPPARYAAGELLGYVEVHIEQGPVLQEKGCALGVVDGIAAQKRLVCDVRGKAGHAGTTPMNLRQDALAASAEIILLAEGIGQATPGLVATVGQIQAEPGASNVIPDRARFTVDIRHAATATAEKACADFTAEAAVIAARRGVSASASLVQSKEGVFCDTSLAGQLETAAKSAQKSVPHLVSGAGHDGIILSQITRVAMLFVRCKDGLSHHPDEDVALADIDAAIAALTHFLENFA